MDFNVLFGPRRQILLPSRKHRTKGDRRLFLLVHLFDEVIRDGVILPQTNSNIGHYFLQICNFIFAFCILGLQHLQLVQLHTEEHSTCMSCRSTMMIGGAGFSADGNKVPYMVAPMAGTGAPDRSGIAAVPVAEGAKWHISHQKASTDSATFLELVSVEFHLGLCDRTKQLQPHYS
ncbi:hypothetical protein EMCRGX_G009462 [Ephydatia muelleri]